jgi:DNA-directed RNA polymerase sigma subunit (sigma70/sigma32)
MTLTAKSLWQWEESMFTSLTAQQRQIILSRFGTEPEPYEWTAQDISEQIRKICLEHPAPQPDDPMWNRS